MTWKATDLICIGNPHDIAQALRGADVLAQLKWVPDARQVSAVTATVVHNDDDAVAVVTDGRIEAGPSGVDLCKQLVEKLPISLWADAWQFHHQGDWTTEPPADMGPVRTAVITPAPISAMPMYAVAIREDLAVLDLGDRRVVFSACPDGQPLGFGAFGWDEDSLPAISITCGEGDRTMVLHPAGDDAEYASAAHSWGLTKEVIAGQGDAHAPGVAALVEEFFSPRADAEEFATYAGVSPARMEAAMRTPGEAEMVQMLKLLGVPTVLADLLEGRIEPTDVPDMRVFSHKSVRSAVRDSMGLYFDEQYPQGVIRQMIADFADSPWRVAIAAAETVAGGVLLNSAYRSGSKVRGLLGALCVVDAASNAFLVPRLRTWLTIEEGEEKPQPRV